MPPHWRTAALEPLRAFGPPPLAGTIRSVPEDFAVEEELGFAPDGAGQHLLLKIRKRDANTEWVARAIARQARVRPSDVGFAGLKDRHAVAVQWFSVPRAGEAGAASWLEFRHPEFTVLEAHAHGRKLRRGSLAANRFRIRVRALRGDRAALAARLALIGTRGVPNYFGPQRFGRDAANLHALAHWALEGRELRGRAERSFTLSAGRSVVFNAVLARRVQDASWDRLLDGEIVNLDGSGSVFRIEAPPLDVAERCAALDVHPTGPLCGRGDLRPSLAAAAVEDEVSAAFTAVTTALETAGLQRERRALRLKVEALAADLGEDLELSFRLGSGAFATAVLRELVDADVAGVTT
ncbi:MAG TPA: tRNA pseudouridine(13) synthase TruD [Steroidobacteraceae bacterium]|nr:tRNA pseudouridine(13) synthase TruD [Steroidobacteraceae bacterium]